MVGERLNPSGFGFRGEFVFEKADVGEESLAPLPANDFRFAGRRDGYLESTSGIDISPKPLQSGSKVDSVNFGVLVYEPLEGKRRLLCLLQ